jgi:hypothetical protein
MKRTLLILCLISVLVIGGYVPVKAELAIHSAVKLEASELDGSETYYILNSPDMMNWSFLRVQLNDLIMFQPVNHIVEVDIKGFLTMLTMTNSWTLSE